MPDPGVRTTATSEAEGRLIVGASCCHGKKKCLKCAVKKSRKDGKGGSGYNPPGYGATRAQTNIKISPISLVGKPKVKKAKSFKMKSLKTLPTGIKSLNRKSKFSSKLKSTRKKTLKSMLKKYK